ncbi:hypothetical protein [Simiduia agarivorans]|uniref:Uncharacterized protein n=1 Tax=Simiduia agarivorans (strain DSM 21679 / JCM 13881 / BCRC 17597 / SA1) TaxID=1117647 RepID=K4KGX2_SIMAS|nr:hypothetical protein [Simiduia agarivorans]AFU97460.1 hypothetical protein M5M_01145 [Simiduia agarivorans SA1 = DSM 21679]
MSSDLYEIIELSTGEIALRRAAEEGEPLVVIKFSEESLYFLKDAKYEVAKAMIEAGMEAAGEAAIASGIEPDGGDITRDQTKTLH